MLAPRKAACAAAVITAFVALSCQDTPMEPDTAALTAESGDDTAPSSSLALRRPGATAAIEKILDTYAGSWLAGDCQTLRSLWAEDGLSMAPDFPPDDVETYYANCRMMFDDWGCVVTRFDIYNYETRVSGKLAFARGDYNFEGSCFGGAVPICVDGKYLTVYQWQRAIRRGARIGEWKMLRDVFNSSGEGECAPT